MRAFFVCIAYECVRARAAVLRVSTYKKKDVNKTSKTTVFCLASFEDCIQILPLSFTVSNLSYPPFFQIRGKIYEFLFPCWILSFYARIC